MNISKVQKAKMSRALFGVLDQALGEKYTCAMFLFDCGEMTKLDPEAFTSREAWRRTMVRSRKLELATKMAPISRELRDIGLAVDREDGILPVIFVSGLASKILQALDMPDLKCAFLSDERVT